MSAPSVVVLDYGSGNVRSAVRALEAAGADVTLTAQRDAVLAADGLVVPGVGAFADTMERIRKVGGPRLIEQRLAGGRPVLGICVGMQILFETGTEHGTTAAGLGQWPGTVAPLHAQLLPHMGWNTVDTPEGSRLFDGVEQERFYFVHSCAARRWTMDSLAPLAEPLITWAEHDGDRFVAAVENGPLSATQFHPEKSGEAGARLLRNWVQQLPHRTGGES